MRATFLVIAALTALALLPSAASAAVCADFTNQAAAQAAGNTRDADHDGVYCESLPCPCSKGSLPSAPPTPLPPPVAPPSSPPSSGGNSTACKRPTAVQRLLFSKTKYPNIRAHFLRAVAKGWPKVMVVNRNGADRRHDHLLALVATKPGFARNEYPTAVGRGKANGLSSGLMRGVNPIGWLADVEYVPISENRSHGASLGAKLGKLCNGVRFRYVFS